MTLTTKKKFILFFNFFCLISIPLLVSFQVSAWVVVTPLYPPFSKDNDWVSLCLLSENMHNKIFIKTAFESHPASFLQGCWKRWIWSRKCWRDGRSSYFWQTMFNSLYESASDGRARLKPLMSERMSCKIISSVVILY